MKDYDFSGWVTRYGVRCADGRTIMRGAFSDCDGKTVPVVWNHQHNDPENVLGHCLLEDRTEGMYGYISMNDTERGRHQKSAVEHKDITALSIYANQLQQHNGGVVSHGTIREVSLVLAGANPGAFIDSVIKHGEEVEDEAIIYSGEDIFLEHADKEEEKPEEDKKEVADEKKEETIGEIFDTLNEKQKNAVYAMIGMALEEKDNEKKGENDSEEKDNSEGGKESMKHNVFEGEENRQNVISHSDEEAILSMAKSTQVGSFQTALQIYAEDNALQHDAVASGFVQPPAEGNVTTLFPEYKDVRPGAPELITNEQGWIDTVMRKVHKSPISRIRTSHVDIRNIDELRARGYQKGKQKTQTGNFSLVRRTTDPQTVYVKNALHRDDIVDITDFDYVQYLYNIDKMMLNEELATAIMVGDGREDGSPDKIDPNHIRPIWLDDELYTKHVLMENVEELQGTQTNSFFGENYKTAEGMIQTCLYAREKNFKGTGTPDMYIAPHMLNVMLLARDRNGRRIFNSKAELASALNVGEIYTVEKFEDLAPRSARTGETGDRKLLAMIVNLADYSLGATKGGEVTHFTQFDIDFNQEKSLIETRVSGALTRVYSAICIEEVSPATAGSATADDDVAG